MQIRQAKNSDAAAIAVLSTEVWINTYLRNGINETFANYALKEFTKEKFEMVLMSTNETILVSENSNGIDGFIRLSTDKTCTSISASPCEITTLYVQPRHQSKHVGLHLLKAGIEHCLEQGHAQPWLAVNTENERAVKFYLRNGFIKDGQTYFEIEDGKYLNEILVFSPH